jgi:hypothetical protein
MLEDVWWQRFVLMVLIMLMMVVVVVVMMTVVAIPVCTMVAFVFGEVEVAGIFDRVSYIFVRVDGYKDRMGDPSEGLVL